MNLNLFAGRHKNSLYSGNSNEKVRRRSCNTQLVGLGNKKKAEPRTGMIKISTETPLETSVASLTLFIPHDLAGLWTPASTCPVSIIPNFNSPAGRRPHCHYPRPGVGPYINACTRAPSHPIQTHRLHFLIKYTHLLTKKQQPAAGRLQPNQHGDSAGSPASRSSFGCALGRQLRCHGLEEGRRGWLRQVPRLFPQRRQCLQRYMQIGCLCSTLALLDLAIALLRT